MKRSNGWVPIATQQAQEIRDWMISDDIWGIDSAKQSDGPPLIANSTSVLDKNLAPSNEILTIGLCVMCRAIRASGRWWFWHFDQLNCSSTKFGRPPTDLRGSWWSFLSPTLWALPCPIGAQTSALGCSPRRWDQGGQVWALRAEEVVAPPYLEPSAIFGP